MQVNDRTRIHDYNISAGKPFQVSVCVLTANHLQTAWCLILNTNELYRLCFKWCTGVVQSAFICLKGLLCLALPVNIAQFKAILLFCFCIWQRKGPVINRCNFHEKVYCWSSLGQREHGFMNILNDLLNPCSKFDQRPRGDFETLVTQETGVYGRLYSMAFGV